MDFETRRAALFSANGAPVQAHCLQDREGRSIGVLERGEGPPVVMLHGGGGHAGEWATWQAQLGTGHRWIAVDRPGHGVSGPIHYHPRDYRQRAAAFVADVLDGLGLPKATLLGNSMGGYFALAFALAHPERVEGLILVGAPAGVDRFVPPPLRLMGMPGLNRLLGWLQGPMTADKLRRYVYPLLVADAEGIHAECLEVAALAGAQPAYADAWRTLLETCVTPLGFRRTLMLRDEVATLATPTQFVWGSADAFAPPSSGEDLVARMPSAGIDVVPGAGHLPWYDAPDACAHAVLAFLARMGQDAAVRIGLGLGVIPPPLRSTRAARPR